MNNNKEVLSAADLQRMLGMKGWFGRAVSSLAIKVLEIDKVNRTQAKYAQYQGPDFSDKILEEVGCTYELQEGALDHIPAEGGFITVSNHHFGSIDGMILSATVGRKRPDYKLLTTFMLSLIPNLASSFMPVDNISGNKSAARSVSGIRMALQHIQEGGALGFFPAGEVATYQKGAARTALTDKPVIEDKPWADNIIKLIRKSHFPVIPIYFEGTNSRNFHWLGKIHPRLRTVRLVHELFNKQGVHVKVHIGTPISPEEIGKFESVEALGLYLRSRTYALEAMTQENPVQAVSSAAAEPIAQPEDPALVREELSRIQDRILFESGDYRCYFTAPDDIPHTMRELARLREMVFRGVGEGTGLAMDTDIYDTYYKHLLLWHIPDGKIAGAYRLGIGPELLARPEGRNAFYTSSLFKFREGLDAYLEKGIELGRTIIVPEYQRDVQTLKLLLSGILTAASTYPELRYTLGPASISNDLPDFFKSLIVRYFQHRLQPQDQGLVGNNHPFQPNFLRVNPDHLLCACATPDDLDHLIQAISGGKYRMPVLLRKYVSFGARILEFNVDPLFNNSLDGFIVEDMADMPDNSYRSFSKFIPEERLRKLSERLGRN